MRIFLYLLCIMAFLHGPKGYLPTSKCYVESGKAVSEGVISDFNSKTELNEPKYKFPEFVVPSVKGLHYAELFETNPLTGVNPRWVDCKNMKNKGEWAYDKRMVEGIRNDYGLMMQGTHRYHCISTIIPTFKPSKGKSFIFQYEVQHQKEVKCGGAYVKLMNYEGNLEDVDSKTPFVILFGPDVCGPDHNKVLFIIKYKQKDGSWTEHHAPVVPRVPNDLQTHIYTLWLKPDNSYEIYVDHIKIVKGDLLTGLMPTIEPMEMIDDFNDKKPADWEDNPRIVDLNAEQPYDWDENEAYMIPDPNSVKPDNWVDEPFYIMDAENFPKPEEWEEEVDGPWEGVKIDNPKCKSNPCGVWEPKMIVNPNYKGKWVPPTIPNPNYKGIWTPKKIKNPDHFRDNEIYQVGPINALTIETWNVEDKIMIDNIIISDNIQSVIKFTEKTWKVRSKNERDALKFEFMGYDNQRNEVNPFFKMIKIFVIDSPWTFATVIVVIAILTKVAMVTLFKLFKIVKPNQMRKERQQPDVGQQMNSTAESKDTMMNRSNPQHRKKA